MTKLLQCEKGLQV